MGLFFQNFQKFWVFAMGAPENFREKIPKNKIFCFLPKWPLKMGVGLETGVAHTHPNQIWAPPAATSRMPSAWSEPVLTFQCNASGMLLHFGRGEVIDPVELFF